MVVSTSSANRSLVFKVTRRPAELVAPAVPTPYELKELSDIDDQDANRIQFRLIQFYRNKNDHSGGTPAKVIKEAVAKALVWYYPFAGRLREKAGRKLVVECNGEGIMFIEATDDVTLLGYGDLLQRPFPCLDDLIFNVPGSTHILDTPLLLFQVTKLLCGGFILGLRLNHTMADGSGIGQFMNAVAELARGAQSPSIKSVWERHLLSARDPPQVTCEHPEYEETDDSRSTIPLDDMVYKSFFFGPEDIKALKRLIPPHQKSSTFEILTACLWRCRTIALQPEPEEMVRILCLINSRTLFNPPLPIGFYGNAFAFSLAISSANNLCTNSIEYALDLIKKTKANVTQEYLMSLANYLVLKGRPHFTEGRTFLVSDATRAGFDGLDFGWGRPTYGGPATVVHRACFLIPFNNGEGEKAIVVPLCLPSNAMEIFVTELNKLLCDVHKQPISSSRSFSMSSL